MKNSKRYPHVLSCGLLIGLTEAEKERLLDRCTARTYKKQQTVLRQGEPAAGLVFVAEGAVEVSYLSEEGNESVVYVALAGDALGAVEGIGHRPYAASCSAFEGTTLLRCDQALLDAQLTSIAFVRGFAGYLHDLLERDNRSKAMHQFFTSEQRISSYILELSRPASDLRFSQSHLANLVGCSRQTVNRELGSLRDAGIIAVGRGRIEVLDRTALVTRLGTIQSAAKAR